jgi:NADPH:quinone reductase-like Zn-dependent oxidoreductase
MFRNYFRIGLRSIWSSKLHSCINIFGLAVGIAVVLLIGGYVAGELQVNKNIKDVERTYVINGAGGGVGTFGVQIGKLYGVEMTGVDSASKLDMMLSMGFDHVIDYTKEDFTKNGQRYDLILDAKTNRSIFDYARALRPEGTYVTVGGSISRLLQILLMAPLVQVMSKKKICIVALKPNKDLVYMSELFEAGKVIPVIDGPYRLGDVPKAFTLFRKGLHKGKVVITV